MGYQALYRKYRPHSFNDFIDQENVKKILINSIINGKTSHAYLFSGPRGIGKTSMAKIFAKAINCLDFQQKKDVCDECENCIEANDNSVDIVEIDAASNNGVDQIRDLKNKITIVPSKLKYKVYIIDEVHMLTNSAFNALLKTLEEPPSHVVFILATTEFYEVPETIVSRCQCFSFSRIRLESLEKRLKYIADTEKIEIDDDTIKEIANFSNGGLRDAIGMLDKLNSFTKERITTEVFRSINGIISLKDIDNMYCNLLNKDLSKVLEIIDMVDKQGYEFKNLIEREMIFVRDKIVNYYTNNGKILGNIQQNVALIDALNDILNKLKDSVNPIVIVQIYLIKYIEDVENSEKIISWEINNENDNKKIIANNTLSSSVKTNMPVKSQHIIKINEQNKKIRINNAMATANIQYKKDLLSKWAYLSKYFMDDKYGKIAQLLSDVEVMVIGTKYGIFTTASEAIINNIYQNLDLVEEFINKIYQHISIVIVLNKEFDNIKNKYIEDKKNNIIYHEQEECGKLIENDNSLINQAINLFGADMVEIE